LSKGWSFRSNDVWLVRCVLIAAVAMNGLTACKETAPQPGASTTDGETAGKTLSREELMEPKACRSCHPGQYEEWAGSMHAYASRDPVFVAMNARGQEETGGKLGNFCVSCHAPMAVAEGLTTDGSNLSQLGDAYQGVTCYFCHNVEAVEGSHNNPLRLANDTVLRGPFHNPVSNTAHASTYSRLMDKDDPASARLCGACHDVVVEAHVRGDDMKDAPDVALERTFLEWQATLFNQDVATGGLTCNGCHMPVSPVRTASAVGGAFPKRASRRHDFEGVDVALVSFPGQQRQRLLTQQFLDSSLLAEVCVSRDGLLAITLENASGHHWPSGATFDRLAWLDVRAFDANGLVFETQDPEASVPLGVIQDSGLASSSDSGDASALREPGQEVVKGPAPTLTETIVKTNGEPAHFFWEAARITSSTALPGVITRDPLSPDYHRERRIWTLDTQQVSPNSLTEVRLTVKLRPIKLKVLEDLVTSGHLSLQIAGRMEAFSLLPQRCHTSEEMTSHPDVLIGANTNCDPTDPVHATTLTWRRDQAVVGNRDVRETVIQGAPAVCMAHPTYIPPAP
jgi:hypothetical protein